MGCGRKNEKNAGLFYDYCRACFSMPQTANRAAEARRRRGQRDMPQISHMCRFDSYSHRLLPFGLVGLESGSDFRTPMDGQLEDEHDNGGAGEPYEEVSQTRARIIPLQGGARCYHAAYRVSGEREGDEHADEDPEARSRFWAGVS